MSNVNLTIKPTLSCNTRCRHCFNGDSIKNKTTLKLATALKALELAANEYETVKITFHGGEPSTMGYDYFAAFYERQQQVIANKGTGFKNFFTTNGIMLDERFINLLKANNVTINISFDGPYNDVLRFNTDKVYSHIVSVKYKPSGGLGPDMR